MKKSVFLQVRLDSSRLPRKALKKIQGKTVIEHAMGSLRQMSLDDYVLLTATADAPTLQPLADKCGFSVFAGDRDDVLKRFIDAGRIYTPDIIIRATGDNPLVAWEKAEEVIQHLESRPDIDYMAMKGLPLGCGVEVFRRSCLETAWASSQDDYDHEHVTPYLYRHPDQFKLKYLENIPAMDNRVTLDTEEDLIRITRIFSDIYRGTPIGFNILKDYLQKND